MGAQMSPRVFQVAGVDGCKAGWFVAIASAVEPPVKLGAYYLERFTRLLKLKSSCVASNFAEVLSRTRQCELVCVDIPIGLSNDRNQRQCDIAARKILRGPRASSVFPAPIRACLRSQDYETASRICLEYTGKKLSKQSFALLEKIRQVDDLMTPELQGRLREIHPEISFWALNDKKPIQANKKTVSGQAQRRKLLQSVFADMDTLLAQPPRGYVMDDALDALVAAWTAGQAVIGKAKTLPDNAQLDQKGLRMEILYPIEGKNENAKVKITVEN
jgi:predicted RNase H-like nuclease